ncbi:hypothetical protein DICSQDRAFT_172054 [Dichomitus squalens LYAD-421 SS1]|uniref:Uncharacterized protein n=1 Tax=Dichomitus squalens (strain LYAD-421) TaxID=732165 RepID=R7SUL5_DICSQ|nr:uncharacterized protein DICSQDRAFT_172054 [Dichomitus squalens LYAD-421 SS1]EJF59460.1 hypothetical protein DICSQDRAFT_172054 [Dichomitus squalens LYAD-421 SS1]
MELDPAWGLEESPYITRKLPSVVKSVGEVSLDQYRVQSIKDLAGRAVQADDVEEFFNLHLPCPGFRKQKRGAKAFKCPKNNPFAALEDADKMSEVKVVRLLNQAIVQHKLVPGLVLSRCENRPDLKKKSRKKSKKDDESKPKVDILRQKIDAAFFREFCAPKDCRGD